MTAVATAIAIGAIVATGGGGGSSPGTANIFVATTGSDTCSRTAAAVTFSSATGHICATLLAACQIAQSGDTVIIEDGRYLANLSTCTGKQNYAQNVVFEPEPGHECPMPYPNVPDPWTETTCDVNLGANADDGLNLGFGIDSTCGVTGHPLPDTLSSTVLAGWVTHLTFEGINIGNSGGRCDAHILLKNDIGNQWDFLEGTYDLTINGGFYCCRTDGQQPTQGDSNTTGADWPPLENVTVENAVISDFMTFGSAHGDGLFTQPSYNVHLIKNVLARDDCIPIYRNYAQAPNAPIGAHGYWVIGNVVHYATDHNGAGDCGQSISLGDATNGSNLSDTIVAFNSIEGPIDYNASTAATNVRIVGNITVDVNANTDTPGCTTGITASYNIMTDPSASNCGDSSNVIGAPQQYGSIDTQPNAEVGNELFHAPLGDYTLQPGVAAIGKVPVSWCSTDATTTAVCAALATDINGNPRPDPAHPTTMDAGAYENH